LLECPWDPLKKEGVEGHRLKRPQISEKKIAKSLSRAANPQRDPENSGGLVGSTSLGWWLRFFY
jgi:hypothetical protein